MTAPLALPHNLPAEAAVLGAILFDNVAFERVEGILDGDDFYAPAHTQVWQACVKLIRSGRVADGVTLREYFETESTLTEIGGARYLANLLDSAAFGAETADYARIVRDCAVRRNLIKAGDSIIGMAARLDGNNSATDACTAARALLDGIDDRGGGDGLQLSYDSAVIEMAKIEDRVLRGAENEDVIKSGLAEYDAQYGGLHRGDLIIIAGRPGMAKTGIASNFALNAAAVGHRGLFLSLEMSDAQTAHRMASRQAFLSGMGRFEYADIRRGKVGQNGLAILKGGLAAIPKTLIQHTQGGLSINDVERYVRAARRRLGGLDFVVLDYIQIMRFAGDSLNRVAAITEATARLKAIAKRQNVAFIALSQINRGVESRDEKRPMLSDLRESGSIEQDADAVIMLYRHEYYLKDQKPDDNNFAKFKGKHTISSWDEWNAAMDACKGALELICAKVRQGSPKILHAHYDIGVDALFSTKNQAAAAADKASGRMPLK